MTKDEMIIRLKAFALNCARLINKLPYSAVNKAYSNQLARCSSSPGANYRAAQRAKSNADFVNKYKIVEEELDESVYFLELIEAMNPLFAQEIKPLAKEGNELLAIVVASLKTLRANNYK